MSNSRYVKKNLGYIVTLCSRKASYSKQAFESSESGSCAPDQDIIIQ